MAEAGANSGLLTVRLVSPDRLLLDATAEAVELPSASGYLEALYGAAPLLAELGAGEVRLHGGSTGEQHGHAIEQLAAVHQEAVLDRPLHGVAQSGDATRNN